MRNVELTSLATLVFNRLVPLGVIVATHGLEGWLKLYPFNPETTALASAETVYVEREGTRWMHRLAASQPYKRHILIKLHKVDDIDSATPFLATTLSVDEDSLPALQPGQYYHFQTIGLEVFDVHGNRLGIVTRTWCAGSGEIYIVTGSDKEYMIPAVKDIIEKIDFDTGKMIINPPDGLLDL